VQPIVFSSRLDRDRDGTWWYAHVPAAVRQALAAYARRGSVPVTATLGRSTWEASLLPWADGSAQLSVKKAVRIAESLQLGDALEIQVVPRG
jgi:hypothetical protein